MSDDHLEVTGTVTKVVKGAFKVKLDECDKIVHARIAGKLRRNKIRILLGDRISLKLSVYDLDGQGIITHRH